MKKNSIYFIYFLTIYVITQYTWWSYYLFHFDFNSPASEKKIWMLLGEGVVFLLILIFTFRRLIVSMKKEINLNEQKNNFLLSITHELKTPIAHNKLTLQTLLKRNNIDPETQRQLTQKILNENDRLERLVENLLTATRLETNFFQLNKERYNLYEQIDHLLKRYSILFANTQVNIVTYQTDLFVNADKFMMETVITNLIENAHKYAAESEEFTVIISIFGDRIRCQFCDTGEGVSEEFQPYIFQKFVRAQSEEIRTKKGTGLGLFICREFLKLNNGTITYQSNKPKGSIFEITLPLA